LSYVPFWQEGAALSAYEAMRKLQSAAAERTAPDDSRGRMK
jgi:hypothetical protein